MAVIAWEDDRVYQSNGRRVEITVDGLELILQYLEQIKQYPINIYSISLNVVMSDVQVEVMNDDRKLIEGKESGTLALRDKEIR